MRMVEEAPDTSYVKALKNPAPKIGWQVEKEWSEVAQCSVVVKKYYETLDSSTVIYFENPDSLHKRFMSEIKPFRSNKIAEWPPEEIIADQKWLDSFFARLDSVLADTTKKKNND